MLLVAACDSGGGTTDPPPDDNESEPPVNEPPPSGPLRDLADERGLTIGAAADVGVLLNNQQYADVLAEEFNGVTPENAMKWNPLRPSRDEFNFTRADQLVDFAAANDMDVRGHTLVWYSQLPSWLTSQEWTREELMTILETHIKTVVGHYEENYPDQVTKWDVVNEAIADSGTELRSNIWLDTIGPEYIAMAFEWAREADPDAELYYNDYNIAAQGGKSDAVYELVSDLVDDGVPIDGVGFQAHLSTEYPAPSATDLESNMQRYEDLGLEVAITELDVRIPLGSDGEPSDEQLQTQADYYKRFMQLCLLAENCNDFRLWGFTDAESWVPGTFEGTGAALIFDEQYNPKPAYDALLEALDQ